MREFNIKKCFKCGSIIETIEDCKCPKDCKIKCCGEEMKDLTSSNLEKKDDNINLQYEIAKDTIIVKTNKPVEWFAFVSDEVVGKKFMTNNETNCSVAFPYIKGSKVYCYSNENGLYGKDVK